MLCWLSSRVRRTPGIVSSAVAAAATSTRVRTLRMVVASRRVYRSLQYALLSLLYYQPARRTAALQEQLAVNEFCELGRVCTPLHANRREQCVEQLNLASPILARSGPNKRLPINAAAAAPIKQNGRLGRSSHRERNGSYYFPARRVSHPRRTVRAARGINNKYGGQQGLVPRR